MNLKILIFLSLIVLISAEYTSYEGYKVYKIALETDEQVDTLLALRKQNLFQYWSGVAKVDQELKLSVAPNNNEVFYKSINDANIKSQLVIENVQRLIDAQMKRPVNRNNGVENYAWDYYPTLDEIYEWLDKMAELYPNVVTIEIAGNSVEGRPIKGVKIDYKKREKPTIGMIEGGIHSREWISPPTVTWIIHEFLTSNDEDVKALAENVVWHIFPVINPDGYVYTFTNNRMWRKNRSQANFTTCAPWNLNDDMSNGIDLNRNFGFKWMTTGASSNPCAETFAGPVAFSEPEATAIANYVYKIQGEGHLVYYIAFHSYSQMFLVPYSHVGGADVLTAPNYADMYEIAIKGAEKLKQRHGTEYVVGTSADILYEVSGSSFDWVKGVAGVPIVYLVELRDVGEYGFLLPPELIIPNNEEILDSLVEMDKVTRQIGYYHSAGNNVYINIYLLALAFVYCLGY